MGLALLHNASSDEVRRVGDECTPDTEYCHSSTGICLCDVSHQSRLKSSFGEQQGCTWLCCASTCHRPVPGELSTAQMSSLQCKLRTVRIFRF